MLNSTSLNFLSISTQHKTMTSRFLHPIKIGLGTKTESWNPLVGIIAQQNLGNWIYGHLVLIGSIWVHEMQGSWLFRWPIRPCEINSHDHIQLKSTPQVVKKRWLFVDLVLFKHQSSCWFFLWIFQHKSSSQSYLSQLHLTLTNKLIFTIFLPIPHLHPS